MSLVCVLFVLVNVAYVCKTLIWLLGLQSLPIAQLCAVSFDQRLNSELDMATLFFREVFGTNVAPRVMSGIIALSVFGNIVVMTFTASRGTISDSMF